MFGWRSCAAIRASSRNIFAYCSLPANEGRTRLSTTWRTTFPTAVPRARKSSAIPPVASLAKISYSFDPCTPPELIPALSGLRSVSLNAGDGEVVENMGHGSDAGTSEKSQKTSHCDVTTWPAESFVGHDTVST